MARLFPVSVLASLTQRNESAEDRARQQRPRYAGGRRGHRLSGASPSNPSRPELRIRLKTPLPLAALVLAAFCAPPLVQADEPVIGRPAAPAAQPGSPSVPSGAEEGLSPVVVTATRGATGLLELPSSTSIVTSAEIEARNVYRFGDAVVDVPGLYVRGAALGTSFPGSGQAVLSLRGIPRTPRTLVMIDGLPINNALSGGVDVAGIAMENIERIEVVRGPYSALWGGNAMGGVINFITASADRPLAQIRGGIGDHGLRSGDAILRKRFAGGLGVSMSFGYRTSDGYPDSDYVVKSATPGAGAIPTSGAIPTFTVDGKPAWWVGLKGPRPWSQTNAQATFDWQLGSATHIATGFGWGEYTVGYSPAQSFLVGPRGIPVFAGNAGFGSGSPTRIALAEADFLTTTPSSEQDLRVFARIEHRFSGGSALKVNLGHLEHRFGFAMAGRGAGYVSGPGELTAQPNERTDLDVSWRDSLGESTILTTGFSVNHSSMDRRTEALSYWRDSDTSTGVSGRSVGKSDNAALFAQTETFVGEHGRLVLGARHDRFRTSGTIVDNTGAGFTQDYPDRSFGRLSPKAAFSWQATPALTLRSSLGAGFRPPALLDLYSRFVVPSPVAGISVVNDASPDLKPERVLSFDVGADLALPGGVQGSATVYAQRLHDLIYRRRLSPTLTRTDNTGEASVNGLEASLRAPSGIASVHVVGSLTHNFRYEVTRNEALPESVGKKLTDVPATMWSLGADYVAGPWSALLVYRHVSHVFGSADDLNLNTTQGVYGSYDNYGVAKARVQYRFTPQLSASLSIDNLTDRQYFVFAKQPGRTIFGEVAYRF